MKSAAPPKRAFSRRGNAPPGGSGARAPLFGGVAAFPRRRDSAGCSTLFTPVQKGIVNHIGNVDWRRM